MREKSVIFATAQLLQDNTYRRIRFFLEGQKPDNLITVPSCDEHNHGVADEEQAFKAWATSSDQVNETGKKIFKSVLRDKKLVEGIKKGAIPINLIRDGKTQPTAFVTIEPGIADGFLTRTTRALIAKFHERYATPQLYFTVGMLNGPRPNPRARQTVSRFLPILLQNHGSKGPDFQFWRFFNHCRDGSWWSLWGYQFYEKIEFAVSCTNQYQDGYWH